MVGVDLARFVGFVEDEMAGQIVVTADCFV